MSRVRLYLFVVLLDQHIQHIDHLSPLVLVQCSYDLDHSPDPLVRVRVQLRDLAQRVFRLRVVHFSLPGLQPFTADPELLTDESERSLAGFIGVNVLLQTAYG